MRRKSYSRIRWIITLTEVFILCRVSAQFENVKLKQLSIEKELPGVTIQTMIQDSKGIMWFGIESVGLCKYDGHDFIVYKNIPYDSTSISNNFASALCEDDEGFIWIGTRSGLNKFDRNTETFIRYFHIPGDTNSISHSQVWAIIKDTKGYVWIATENGINKYDKDNDRFIHYLTDFDISSKIRITSLCLDRLDNIWAGTRNYGLFEITPYVKKDGNDNFSTDNHSVIVKNWRHNANDPYSLQHDEIRSVIEAEPGKIWVGTLTGLDRLDIVSEKFEHSTFEKGGNTYLKNAIFNVLCKDNNGNLWAGTANNGLVVIKSKTLEFKYLHVDPTYPYGIKSNYIRSVVTDNSGLVWIGTKFAGLQLYDSRQETFPIIMKSSRNKPGLSDNFVLCITQDSDGIFWIGTKTGGLNRYNRETGEFKSYIKNPDDPYGIISNRIEKIVEDKNKNLWLATDKGLAYFDKKDETFYHYGNMHLRTLLYDNQGRLWAGTSNGVYVFNKKNKTLVQHDSKHTFFSEITSNITKIYEDRLGIIWFCSYNEGIFQYSPEQDELYHHYHHTDDSTSISGDMIRSIYEDRFGRIWIGTISDGLNLYDRVRNTFTTIKTSEGLPLNTVYSIVEDDKGNLWLGTHNGISKFNTDKLEYDNYDIAYGLQGKVFEINAYCIANDGEIYLGGRNGVNHFFPDKIRKTEYIAPMILSSLNVLDQTILRDVTEYKEVTLKHNDNYIFIDFSLLDYRDPNKNEYAYILEGFDNDWIKSGNRHFTSYTRLPPGEYIFKAIGANLAKDWNEKGISIKLIIPKPFWKKRWFIVILIILIIIFIVGIYLIRIKSIRKQQLFLQEQVKQRTKDLREAYTILEQQKLEIEKRNLELTTQSDKIRKQNTELEKHRTRLEQLVQERTKDLENAKEKAEESDRLKSAFLANMSHEIRTPLNAIIGFSDILVNEKLTEVEITKYNRIVKTNSVSLLQLIDDIIDISKIEAGQIEVRKREFHLHSYLQTIIEIYKEYIAKFNREKNRQVRLIYKQDKRAKNIYLIADTNRLKQVFDNLLSNAIKFTKRGEIEIGFRYIDNEDKARLYVKDTGIGIEKENFAIIFDRFRKIETRTTELYRGTGIGLSITKNLVNLMGGQINLESEVGEGTMFYFDLPAKLQSGSIKKAKGKQVDWENTKPEGKSIK